MCDPLYSPADSAKTTLITNCLSLRNNAACCIRLRPLRYLRENNMQEYSICYQRRNPNVSRRLRRSTQTNYKQRELHCLNYEEPVFLSVIWAICFSRSFSPTCLLSAWISGICERSCRFMYYLLFVKTCSSCYAMNLRDQRETMPFTHPEHDTHHHPITYFCVRK